MEQQPWRVAFWDEICCPVSVLGPVGPEMILGLVGSGVLCFMGRLLWCEGRLWVVCWVGEFGGKWLQGWEKKDF